jgi:acyl-CoA thioester hydrolase
MKLETPFRGYEGEVRPEWIDTNGHMNLAYYVLMFDFGTDAIYGALGLGPGYQEVTGCGTFAVESHVLYARELLVGERAAVSTLVLGADAKRIHLGHEMIRVADGARAATQEVLLLHVDLGLRRVVPWPEEIRERLAEAASAHATVLRPDWVGRRVAMP